MHSLLPSVGWHYYRPEYGPFRNICALPDAAAERILDEIRARYDARWLVPTYLHERRAIEAWLRDGFRAKGGRAPTAHPIYLALGDERVPNYGPDNTGHALRVPLALLAPDTVSFTYPDSMFSYGLAHYPDDPRAATRKPYHGEVFTRDEIERVVARYGLPGEEGKRHLQPPLDHRSFIEAQVWDLRPLIASWVKGELQS